MSYREIKFRGKTNISMGGRWLYGNYGKYGYEKFVTVDDIIVNEKTVGQYINKKIEEQEIYEGDMLKLNFPHLPLCHGRIFTVRWIQHLCKFVFVDERDMSFCSPSKILEDWEGRIKIIGNIHDGVKDGKV